MSLKLFSDGGARGNPGPSGIGFILFDNNNNLLWFESKYIGEATNNIAEYMALFEGLKYVHKNHPNEELICHLDSELVVKQLNGEYKIKNEGLKPLFSDIKKLVTSKTKFVHIERAKNKFADKLVNISLDAKIS